ncbi:hypothetical protein [Paraburkholderia sp. Cpub6]|uniref:hypothetical protein n=1 Tax=Paraburkholderia sp. Cpub6 TaxID=2723094 RepID=UPI001616A900|nr:hypothetical protein [Paraburkholderia sp. Cpub6]MBB5463592.1 DNA-binding CsgD family transcriptional regulator [Paraburkholderia sp. Cpub6]
MSRTSSTKLGAHIRHVCALGFDSATIIPSVVAATREIVGADFGHFMWSDERFAISSVYSEIDEAYKTLGAYEHLRRTGHVSQLIGDFSEWMSLSCGFTNSDHLGPALERSAFYGEVLSPTGGRHFINVVARHGARGWGSLILVREKGRRPFTDAEYRLVDAFSRHIGNAVRHGSDSDGPFADGARSGILVVDWNGRIRHQSRFAYRLMLESIDRTCSTGIGDDNLPSELASVVRSLRAIERGLAVGPAVKEITNRWGRFTWSAYPLNDLGCVLHCQHQEPILLQALRAARSAGLSDRKQIVAARLVCGSSYHCIACLLRVKDSTVADCVRNIYWQLGVSSVSELRQRLLNTRV